jgi:hypothetical protein
MPAAAHIRYCKRHEVEDAKWNACITAAPNGLVYAYSFYLDAMAGRWDALVLGDYEAVMPLTWRNKWGVYYLYQPPFCAQLGVFGKGLNEEVVRLFLTAIPQWFQYWDFYGNQQNLFRFDDYPVLERVNYVLPLHLPYEQLEKSYRENTRRNIRKSKTYGCGVKKEVAVEEIIALSKMQSQQSATKDDAYEKFAALYKLMQQKGMAKTYGIASVQGQLIASAVFFFSHKRAYYILVGNHPNGRTLGASHALIDAFIQDHAGQDLLLDFEGSDLRNLAFFYSSFGAVAESYPAFYKNDLPWWMKWLRPPHPPRGN